VQELATSASNGQGFHDEIKAVGIHGGSPVVGTTKPTCPTSIWLGSAQRNS
jgi:hypothetical protein